MITVEGIEFVPYQGSPLGSIESYSGFEVTASGMNIYIASGNCTGLDYLGEAFDVNIPSASATVTAPDSGQLCFGFWVSTDFDLHFINDSSVYPPVFDTLYEVTVVKALWGYVDAGDTTLDGKTVYINL